MFHGETSRVKYSQEHRQLQKTDKITLVTIDISPASGDRITTQGPINSPSIKTMLELLQKEIDK